jgi:hypothetical protein
MTKTFIAAVLAATGLIAPVAHAQSSKGIPTVSMQDRQAQQAWWAKRSARMAERHMAACMTMPECAGARMISGKSSNKG